MHGHQGRYPNIKLRFPQMYENLSLKTYHFGNVKFLTDGNNIFSQGMHKRKYYFAATFNVF